MKAYEVQQLTVCDGWVNNWTITEDDGEEIKSQFATYEEAEEELQAFLDDVRDAVARGHIEDEEDPENFRIVEVEAAE